MNKNHVLMKGNEALAEAAIRAGCRFFSGYPITPQTEIMEYLCWRMPEVGGQYVQTEDEISGIHMLLGASAAGARVITSSSGPGFSLKQEGLSFLVAGELPAVIVDVARVGSGLGDIFQSQGDYSLVTKGNGHGDSMIIALTPNSVQETVDFTVLAFDLAEKYRHPVIILSDAAIGQTMEGLTLPEMREHDIDANEYALRGRKKGTAQKRITNLPFYLPGGYEDYDVFLREKYARIIENEQRWENTQTKDAEVVIVAYGISSRVAKEAVIKGRKEGIKLGLIRLQTVTPFPIKAFKELSPACKGILGVEMSTIGQMTDDIALATDCTLPIYGCFNSSVVPKTNTVIEHAKNILAGRATPVRSARKGC